MKQLKFSPTKDFYCEETQSMYVAGLKYTVRTEKLYRLVAQWLLVEKVIVAGAGATMSNKRTFLERVKPWLSRIHF